MSDPAQQRAARAALAEASRELWMQPQEFIVYEVARQRRANTKAVFYRVRLALANGVRLIYQVSDEGNRVERTELIRPPFPPPIPAVGS